MKNKKNILYVEDDETLAFLTIDNLQRNGYNVQHFTNGQLALNSFPQGNFSICILDIMLPKMDGYSLAKQIRSINNEIPIIFLSAKSQTEDRIYGLELGADDYLVKPFSIQELILKIEVFLKRKNVIRETYDKEKIQVGNYLLDINNQLLVNDNNEVKLTQRETKLIEILFRNKNELIQRNHLLMRIWGDDSYFNGRSLDVFISRVRKYLKDDPSLNIENIRSTGFRLNQKKI